MAQVPPGGRTNFEHDHLRNDWEDAPKSPLDVRRVRAMYTVLIIEDEPLCRQLVADVLQHRGYSVATAANGKEALAILSRQPVDLAICDLVMPHMDGCSFLRALRTSAWSKLPVIVVTGLVDPNAIRACGALGVRDFLLKATFKLEDLLARVARRVNESSSGEVAGKVTERRAAATAATTKPSKSASDSIVKPEVAVASAGAPAAPTRDVVRTTKVDLPCLLDREETLERVEQHTQSKTLAGVVTQVIGLASSPRASVVELVNVLKRDAVLASRVLQVANSAAFTANRGPVMTVEEAVRNVGLSTVRSIATSVGVFDAFPCDGADGFNLIRCWQHSFAVAAVLQKLAERSGAIDAGVAHLVGLCHDLGEIVLRQCFAEQYAQVLAVAGATGQALQELERAVFGIRRCELIEHVLQKLALPKEVAQPILQYHEQEQNSSPERTDVVQALRMADLFAHGLLLASSPASVVAPLTQRECRQVLGASPAPLGLDAEMLRSEVVTSTCMLARLSSPDEQRLTRPLLPRHATRICYARHPAYNGTIDPLATALGFLGEVDVTDTLPTNSASAGEAWDALVVATPRLQLAGFSLPEVHQCSGLPMATRPIVCIVGSTEAKPESVPSDRVTVVASSIPLGRLYDLLASGHQSAESRHEAA